MVFSFFSSQGWIKSPHIVYFWAYLIQQNWPENSQQRLVNQLDTAAKFFAKKFTTTTFCKGCYFPAGLLKQKKVKKKTVKEIPRRRSFSRVLSFWNKSLWTRANLETKEQQIPMVSHTKKRRSDRKQKIPWAVISLSPFVQDIRSFLKRSKVYFGILLSSKYLEHSRSSLWQKYLESFNINSGNSIGYQIW